MQPGGYHLACISAVPAEGEKFQCTNGTKSWRGTSTLWWSWLLNTFPFSKENKHTFVPPKTTGGGLATLCLWALWCLPWACLGLKPFSRRAEVWAWGQHGHVPTARFGMEQVWVLQGEAGVGGTHGTLISPAGALRPHVGVLKPPGKSSLSQPVHFSLWQSHSSPTASLAEVISCLLSLVWVWPHPWVRRASLPQRPGQGKWWGGTQHPE